MSEGTEKPKFHETNAIQRCVYKTTRVEKSKPAWHIIRRLLRRTVQKGRNKQRQTYEEQPVRLLGASNAPNKHIQKNINPDFQSRTPKTRRKLNPLHLTNNIPPRRKSRDKKREQSAVETSKESSPDLPPFAAPQTKRSTPVPSS